MVPGEGHERVDALRVRDGLVLDPPDVFEVAVLGPDAGVVQPGRARVHGRGLAGFILEQEALEPVDGTRRSEGHGGGVLAGDREVGPGGLHADHVDLLVPEEGGEEPDGVASAADARDERVGELPAGELLELLFRFAADDGLEIADHHRERVGTDDGSDGVELRHRVLHVGAERGVHGLFEGLEAVRGGNYVGT